MIRKKLFAGLVLAVGLVGYVAAETDYIALPVIDDIRKGVDNENAITTLKVTGTGDIDGALNVDGALVVDGATSVGGALTVTGAIKSGGRTAITSSNTTGNVVIEYGSKTSVLDTTSTNTFGTTFIEAPTVLWRAVSQDAATPWSATNAITVASNKFSIVFGATNVTYSWIAIGKKL